ncbi:MAG TPA: alpha/beta fold hydrolase [Pseudomonadales bacterium]|nr:alpha/beta fold hydrolase [Pseudomonadales bacterium]
MRRRITTKLLNLMLLCSLFGAALSAQAESFPVSQSRASVTLKALSKPGQPPLGANNWQCRSSVHPYPVILIPGTFNNMQVAYGALSPLLANQGYCVFSLNYGGKRPDAYLQSTGSLEESNRAIAAFVQQVLNATGAEKVTLVGHSQGGLHAILIARSPAFAGKIAAVIGLAPSTHGTELLDKFETAAQPTLMGALIKKVCVACEEQRENSSAVLPLNADSMIAPGVQYHILATRDDHVILPPSRSFIQNAQADNLYLQDVCPAHHVSHRGLLYDNATGQWVLSVLAGRPTRFSCKV